LANSRAVVARRSECTAVAAGARHLLGASTALRREADRDAREAALYQQIGKLQMELWTGSKQKLPSSIEVKRSWIEPNHPELSIRHQCELLQLNRTTYYRQPGSESKENLALMRRIDEQFLLTPFYGSRRMAEVLGSKRRPINRKHVQRLMRLMGLEAIYPKPRTNCLGSTAYDNWAFPSAEEPD
jgi:putative transposase